MGGHVMPAEKEIIDNNNVVRESHDVEPVQNVQDSFLNQMRREHLTVTLYLMNGIKLIGRIKSFDRFSVLLDAGQQEMLIFKHAISTVSSPRQSVQEARRPDTATAPAKDKPKPRTITVKKE
ncbi:MAG: RNA chaperone Hfq [Acidobacteriota bacterium]|nr:RNA chaperone Hfq [Blastocatellia bacterium]MDW8239049.1 RNA chaperone Hfq [Acidobacteriota bacterium]